MSRVRSVLVLGGLFIAAALFACASGTQGLGMVDAELFVTLRLPRVLLGMTAGMALAVAGVGSQALLQNPLADPYVLGVSGGAALGAVLVGLLVAQPPLALVMAAAIAGALLASLLVFARSGSADVKTLLLTGVVFNSFAAALITLIKTAVSAQKAQEILYWLMGQLSVYEFSYIAGTAVACACAVGALVATAPQLDALVQGDEVAQTLGVDPKRVRRVVYLALTVLVGAVVAVTGLIGFVGLVVPQLARRLVGPKHLPLLLASGAIGAALVLTADACCRLAFQWFDTELPVGVLTAFIGAPHFMWSLRLRR